MINAIAEAKTGRSMKKFMTQINSVVGAEGRRIAESSTYEPPIIAARLFNGRRGRKSCLKRQVLPQSQMGVTGRVSGVRSCFGSGGGSCTPRGCQQLMNRSTSNCNDRTVAACWPPNLISLSSNTLLSSNIFLSRNIFLSINIFLSSNPVRFETLLAYQMRPCLSTENLSWIENLFRQGFR